MSDARGFGHAGFLAETDWLAEHLDDPDLVVLDCTTHLIPDPKINYTVQPGREDFEKGHIPGAQFFDLQADLSAKDRKLRFMMSGPAAFAAAMGQFGIGNKSRVIFYSTTNAAMGIARLANYAHLWPRSCGCIEWRFSELDSRRPARRDWPGTAAPASQVHCA